MIENEQQRRALQVALNNLNVHFSKHPSESGAKLYALDAIGRLAGTIDASGKKITTIGSCENNNLSENTGFIQPMD